MSSLSDNDRRLMIEKLTLLTDHNSQIDDNPFLKIEIPNLDVDEGSKFVLKSGDTVTISSLNECENFQCEVCSFILECPNFLENLPTDCCWSLWDCLFSQLEFGGFEVKQKSFSIILHLFKSNQFVGPCLRYTVDLAFSLAEWFVENWCTLVNPPNELLLGLIEVFEYFNEDLSGDLHSLIISSFAEENVDFFVNMFNRCVGIVMISGNFRVPTKFVNCLLKFLRELCKTVRIFDCYEFSNDQTKLLIDNIMKTITYCLEQDLLEFDEYSSLLSELVLLCPSLNRKADDNEPQNNGFAHLNEEILTVLGQFVCTRGEFSDEKRKRSLHSENGSKLKNDIIRCKIVVETLLLVLKHDLKHESKIVTLKLCSDIAINSIGKDKFLIQKLKETCIHNDKIVAEFVYKTTLEICCLLASFSSSSENNELLTEIMKFVYFLNFPWLNRDDQNEMADQEIFKDMNDELQILYCSLVASFSFNNDGLFEAALVRLVNVVVGNNEHFSNVAKNEIRLIAERRKLTLKQLYVETCDHILNKLMAIFVEDLKHNENISKLTVEEFFNDFFSPKIQRLCVAFELIRVNDETIDLKVWSRCSERRLIPCLLSCPSPETSKIHKVLAMLLKTNRNSLVSNNVSHVLLKLCFSKKSDHEIKAIIKFLEEECSNSNENLSFSNLIASDSFNCIVQLVTHLALNEENVLNYLKEVFAIRNLQRSSSDDDDSQTSDEQITEELSSKIFGIVINFEEKLRNSEFSRKEKLWAIQSLAPFLKICHENVVGDAKLKILSVLKIAARIETADFQKACGIAWLALLEKLNLENLRNVCLQFFVSLLPLVEKWFNCYEQTFLYLCKDKKRDLLDQLSDFKFLLDFPEYESVMARLPFLKVSKSSEPVNIRSSLAKALKIIQHGCTEVKVLGLQKLAHVLRTSLNHVYRLVLDAESVDSIIPELMDHLLCTLGHSNDDVRYFAAICIGELGAIDPGRLQSNAVCATVFEKKNYDVADFDSTYNTKFAVNLLTELSNCLTRASFGSSYNVYSFVIQETLKIFDFHSNDKEQNSPSEAIFEDLSQSVRAVVSPFLSTHFVISKSAIDLIDVKVPIFSNLDGLSMQSWLTQLIRYLVKRIKNPKAKFLFEQLSFAAEFELNFARYILPHVVLQKLRESDDVTATMIFDEILAVLNVIDNNSGTKREETNNFHKQAAQEIFSLLDFLNVWCLENRSVVNKNSERTRVENLLNSIPCQSIVDCALRCQAYTRALMNFDKDLQCDTDSVHDNLAKLQELYACLGDVDSVTGVLVVRKIKKQPSPREEILAAECLGNYVEALPFHELITEIEPDQIKNHLSLVKCLLKLNQPNLALHYLDGLLKKKRDFEEKLQASRIETLCKLQDWNSLENELTKPQTYKTWGTDVADLLLTVRNMNEELFSEKLRLVRNDLLTRLEAVVRDSGAYDRAYKYVLRLHMVSEIENGATVLLNLKNKQFSNKTKDCLSQEWDDRLQILQQSTDAFNQILDVRRQLFSLADGNDVENSVKYSWLQSLRIARKTGHLQTANSLLPKVKMFNLPETFVEEARLLWLKDDQDAATKCLYRLISSHYKDLLQDKGANVPLERKKEFADVQLRLANFARESLSTEAKDITRLYKHLLEIHPTSDAHYYLALHYDQIESKNNLSTDFELRLEIIKQYGCSLREGSKYLHHAMPRMLTLWLDSVSKLQKIEAQTLAKAQQDPKHDAKTKQDTLTAAECLIKFNKEMSNNANALPPYQFYSSFSQLISRFGSQSVSTVEVLKEIIARVILIYPQQCLWMSIAVSHSSVPQRKNVCQDIYKLAISKKKELKKLIDDFHKIVELLRAVCVYKTTSPTENMKDTFKELFHLFGDGKNRSNFSEIMLPLQSLMDVTLPTPGDGKLPGELYNPFPSTCVYIKRFEPIIQVFPTLQRPKKVTMLGTDGRRYSVLCKPKDDLRLDKRVMEFTSLVNVFLLRDPEARRRQLKIRTYAVTPLSEDFGLLEWVEDLEAMRSVVTKIYKERNLSVSLEKLRALSKKMLNLDAKLTSYQNELLPKHPSVLNIWFRRCFPDPTAWYLARQNYVRTTAVMSMVGYILGLGDRHGENILFDTVTGDVVHVDFNCLFNKGEYLEVPEVVPFRLTHNMIKAMGPLGYEGAFRKTCEVTMRMMRQEKETLRTVLETFLYDPLVEWRKPDEKTKQPNDYGEVVSEKAHRNLKNIDLRLKGSIPVVEKIGKLCMFKKNSYSSPLNIEGQVNHLLMQATNESLLSQMYIGWAAYM